MDESQKDEILRRVKSAQSRVDDRRDKMLQALELLQETMSTVLENIEGLPAGLGLLLNGDVIVVGQSDGKAIVGDPMIAARVGWTEPDTGAAYVTYEIKFAEEEESREFTDINVVAQEIAEILVEDVYKADDLKALAASAPQQQQSGIVAAAQAEAAAGSAPPDAAAHVEFLWEGINAKGEVVNGSMMALNKDDVLTTLRTDGISPTKAVEKSELPTT